MNAGSTFVTNPVKNAKLSFCLSSCRRAVPAEELVSAKLRVPSFHQDFGPSFDGVTVKNNFADIKGRRSFGTRCEKSILFILLYSEEDALLPHLLCENQPGPPNHLAPALRPLPHQALIIRIIPH